jgi:hypothetical protein
MDVVRKVLDAFRPYNNKAMILGACIFAGHLTLGLIRRARKLNLYKKNVLEVNVLPYTNGRKDPWALIIFDEGDTNELKILCERLVFLGIHIYILTTKKQQALMDILQSELTQTPIKFRYSYRIFQEYDSVHVWEDLQSELSEIDCRVLFNFGGSSHLGWRVFEENEKKAKETDQVVAKRYTLPAALLAFAKTGKGGRRLVVQINNLEDPEMNEVDECLLSGAGRELLEDEIEINTVVGYKQYLAL